MNEKNGSTVGYNGLLKEELVNETLSVENVQDLQAYIKTEKVLMMVEKVGITIPNGLTRNSEVLFKQIKNWEISEQGYGMFAKNISKITELALLQEQVTEEKEFSKSYDEMCIEIGKNNDGETRGKWFRVIELITGIESETWN